MSFSMQHELDVYGFLKDGEGGFSVEVPFKTWVQYALHEYSSHLPKQNRRAGVETEKAVEACLNLIHEGYAAISREDGERNGYAMKGEPNIVFTFRKRKDAKRYRRAVMDVLLCQGSLREGRVWLNVPHGIKIITKK